MVLFLFIIMLLDLRVETRRKINTVAVVGGSAVALAFFLQVYLVVGQLSAAKEPFPPLSSPKMDDVHSVGLLLFSNYNLPFQIIGVLVLVATVGVIVLSKRELR
jgi:NADH-quinone oxidoreductase subunit J